MKAVKTIQKYKCDFCKRRGVKSAMERHEGVCFRNPNRYCEYCGNTGQVEMEENRLSYKVPCHFCSQFKPEMLQAIEARESNERTPHKYEDAQEMPF